MATAVAPVALVRNAPLPPIVVATQVPCESLVAAVTPGPLAPGTKFSPPMTRLPTVEAVADTPESMMATTTPRRGSRGLRSAALVSSSDSGK